MKLYVREGDGVLTDYYNGMVCVLANDFEEAIRLIEEKDKHALRNMPIEKYKVIETPEAFVCRG